MVDVLTPEQRRLNMSRIRGRDTKPEMIVRRGLHALGLRHRLHVKQLPGTPDLVYKKHNTVVFVHGCFWHAHGCRYSKYPSGSEAWRNKLNGNIARDEKALFALLSVGWRVLVIWECSLRGKNADIPIVLERAKHFLIEEDARVLDIPVPRVPIRLGV